MDMLDFFKCDEDFNNYLFVITGFSYLFTVASSRKWNEKEEMGVFYQVSPESKDDGFFDWYSFKMPERQFFRTKTEAVMRFTIQWLQWNRSKGLSLFK